MTNHNVPKIQINYKLKSDELQEFQNYMRVGTIKIDKNETENKTKVNTRFEITSQ